MSKTVGVIGLGNWGTALAQHLARKGFDVLGWTIEAQVVDSINKEHRHPVFLSDIALDARLKATLELEQLLELDTLLLVVPSAVLGKVVPRLQLRSDAIIVSAVKGFEFNSASTPLQYMSSAGVKCRGMAVLSGPSFARDVVQGLPAGIVSAAQDLNVAKEVAQLFTSDSLKVYFSTDVIGVELGGAVKNVVALAAGLCDGLKLGDSARAGLITRGLAEMTRLGAAMGADERTFSGLSGLGDLVMTACSDLSRNRRAGFFLGQGKKQAELGALIGSEIEGLHTAPIVMTLSQRLGVEMPVTSAVANLLAGKISAQELAKTLLSRPSKAEF